MKIKKHIILEQLLGKPICNIGRCSNMLWLGIGEKIKIKDINGKDIIKSTIALHVQSMWRIVNKEKNSILLASSDFYSPNSMINEYDNFEWDIQGNNLFDEKVKAWINKDDVIYINDYKLNKWGDLILNFSNNDFLEIYVDSSDDTESWRVFKCNSNEEHLVVTGLGINFE